MEKAHVVQEDSPNPAQERPVNGRQSATQPCPLSRTVVRNRGVRMMQEREHDQPVIRQLSSDVNECYDSE